MDILLVFAVLLPVIFNAVLVYLAYRWLKNKQNEVIDLAKAYFESPGDDRPSQFALFLDLAAQNFSSRLMQSARAQLANMASIDTRQNKKLEADGMAAGLPGAIGAIPGIGRMMQKNPLLYFGAQYLASKMGGGAPAPSNGSADVQAHNNGNNPFGI